jgi:hypothetical protein
VADSIAGGSSWWRKLLAFALIAVIGVCAVLIVFVNLSKPWTVAAQVSSAIAGAALGSILSVDFTRRAVENHVRPSVRRLFDQAIRLRILVQRVEEFGSTIEIGTASQNSIELRRAADRFELLGYHLRDEITATASAIEDWGDLAHPVYTTELEQYRSRGDRHPDTPPGKGSRQ